MKSTRIMYAIVFAVLLSMSAHVSAQTKDSKLETQTSTSAAAVKMPAEYSKQIDTLQDQSKKLETDYSQVIGLYKDYVSKRDQIQAQAAVLITRAALAAHMTIEQLDNSELVKDEKGNWEWREKPKAAPVTAQPSKTP